ncbi:MAG: AIPR family protein [Gemmatimonadaceae bacterium]
MTTESKALSAFEARSDLEGYGSNALLLFALQLRWGIADIEGVAATALTDHANDKKCDLVYVDRDAGRVVVAQGYLARKHLEAAPANKASDLNTAVTWLLSGDVEKLPETLRSAAEEVRDAIEQDQISDVHIWYSHNAPESENVRIELGQAARTADSLIKRYFPDRQIAVSALEVGREQLEEMYARTEAPIAVSAEFSLSVSGGFEVESERWKAFTTAVPGTWLREQWDAYGGDLMSPNVRDYLGIVRSERNINNGIKTSASETPEQFWIYNNGITVLVHEYQAEGPTNDGSYRLKLKGLGIVNGAQTTGALATLSDEDAPNLGKATVLTRFVKCDDPDVLADIVKFNNTQNKVEAADFRSKDAVQERLREEFAAVPDADYRGGRRGGVKDAIERSRNLLPDSAVAQALAAFYGQPNLAYNETRRIWEENAVYARYFTDRTSARHVVFAYSLLRALEGAKKRINDVPDTDRTEAQKRHTQFFRRRGSIHLLVAAISSSIETFLDKPIPDRTRLRFADNCSPKDAVERWQPVVDAALSFSTQLLDATDTGLKNPETVRRAMEPFQAMIEATADVNREKYDGFTKTVDVGVT